MCDRRGCREAEVKLLPRQNVIVSVGGVSHHLNTRTTIITRLLWYTLLLLFDSLILFIPVCLLFGPSVASFSYPVALGDAQTATASQASP